MLYVKRTSYSLKQNIVLNNKLIPENKTALLFWRTLTCNKYQQNGLTGRVPTGGEGLTWHLVPPKGHLHGRNAVGVDVAGSSLQVGSHAMSAGDVPVGCKQTRPLMTTHHKWVETTAYRRNIMSQRWIIRGRVRLCLAVHLDTHHTRNVYVYPNCIVERMNAMPNIL